MPESEAKKQWFKENSINITVKLMKRTEPDLVEFLDSQLAKGIGRGTMIKIALREYMQNHKEELNENRKE